MNWGYKIALSYLAFMTLILSMVFMSFQYDVNLVAKDYYKQEMAYQEEIDKISNTQKLYREPEFGFKAEGQFLSVFFPKAEVEGVLTLYRPSDARQDQKFLLSPDEQGQQYIPIKSLKTGLWRIKLDWKSDGLAYYLEKKIQVTPAGSLEFLN